MSYLSGSYDAALRENEALRAERDNWKDSAGHFANGQEFYQGIVRQIGEMLGKDARTSDDGSVQGDVLALKVPGLVEALAAHVELLSRAAYEVCNDSFSYGGTSMAVNAAGDLVTGDRGKYPCSMTALAEAAVSTPTTSLAIIKAQWQAEALEDFANEFGPNNEAQDAVISDCFARADELRRQAEGEQP